MEIAAMCLRGLEAGHWARPRRNIPSTIDHPDLISGFTAFFVNGEHYCDGLDPDAMELVAC